ncbi:aminotransferase class V-fold PLP-dependent enzyme [Agilicoccus flavus]|uniref:aminotransferase class V-fold PLP-dependent enzyme n=1 Tax=Agilicoccus flavus TaxID=2775968 RepID=UPI001CF61541|nr:aminotransferase class V-fold PLP-dependent enzyme [Agilicoccus flavus]
MTDGTPGGAGSLSLERAQREFAPTTLYLNTASMGLPPARTTAALHETVDAIASGELNAGDFDDAVDASRATYARLVGVGPEEVAIGSQASALVGLVAASLPDGAAVLLAAGDFTSVSFPFLAQEPRITVREVPLGDLAEAVTDETTIVAVSLVQSADGAMADLDALVAACEARDARLLLDLTQSAGWLPIDARRADYTVCAAYKWLLCPRGAAFLTVRPDRLDGIVPHAANWYAGGDVWSSIYGGPLRLADTARRFDVSPAWPAWVGARPSLELLEGVGVRAVGAHSIALADAFRDAVGVRQGRGGSPIVSVPLAPGVAPEQVAAALARHRITAAMRAGRLRLSFHLPNTPDDVGRAVELLAPYLT